MQASINADLVKKLTPKEKPFEVWDNTLKRFIVRVQPSGTKTYIVEYARHKRITIGQILQHLLPTPEKRFFIKYEYFCPKNLIPVQDSSFQ